MSVNVDNSTPGMAKTRRCMISPSISSRYRVTALIGPSGCGKSTFVRCLNRMHEEVPGTRVAGDVLVEGANIYDRYDPPNLCAAAHWHGLPAAQSAA